MKAKGKFTITKWNESPYMQVTPEMKMAKASVEYAFTGDIEGQAFVEYVLYYKNFNPEDKMKAQSQYVGLMKFDGHIGGKDGSFVIQDTGIYEKGTAISKLEIIEGSGIHSLKQIKGFGSYRANVDGSFYEFEYDL